MKSDRRHQELRSLNTIISLEFYVVKNNTFIDMTETEITNNIPQPDANWDYYEVWQSLHSIKNKIDAGLKFIADQEKSTPATDQELKGMLMDTVGKLEEIIDFDLTVPFE
ncbi:hypothetical protein IQ244_22105 [Nostoc sp. LEGE 06077]|uniref:hypothetical protein n=1 Tax=Nostoc sp. LEGE 06077 TaxID=915325 RepID=UPI001882C3C2|nr:hypothetical protein [Nostoc sp. LEGE 06077]MBE9209180.1 hypothetical protein [Nostoc sp. LEGE 06077]